MQVKQVYWFSEPHYFYGLSRGIFCGGGGGQELICQGTLRQGNEVKSGSNADNNPRQKGDDEPPLA